MSVMKPAELKALVKKGEMDTVIVAFPDVLGRLVGKRFRADYFLDHVVHHGTHGCNYLLTVNMEMDPMDGFAVANWDAGFGDFEMVPDMSTLRRLPWQPGTGLVLCDYRHEDGCLVAEAPRSILAEQLAALRKRKLKSGVASELEFLLFNQTYSDAFRNRYHDLTPSSDYRIDYHTMQPARDEPILRAIRNQMTEAGIPIESSKGEWSQGQHEINFVYRSPMEMADGHVIFKQGVKEIAEINGKSVSFMPKFAAAEAGNSCHIHLSLARGQKNIFWDPQRKEGSSVFRRFLGGLLKYAPELCYFFAPTVNAYKRYQSGSWAPTKMAWAFDNRTVGFRVVGSGEGFRIENRMPGADANPYLAFAATLAAGLAGVDEKLDAGPVYQGNAYEDPSLAALPRSLREAADRLEKSALARRVFGDAVVEFYVHTARLEVEAFDGAITDWERCRYFERI